MTPEVVLSRIFEEQTVAAPVITVSYEAEVGGRHGRVCHTVSEMIYSAFDTLFAAQVYATSGQSLPRARVETLFVVDDLEIGRRTVSGCMTLLDALTQIVSKARPSGRSCLIATPGDLSRHQRLRAATPALHLDEALAEAMQAALALVSDIADPGLCRVAATLDGATVYFPDSAQVFAEIDFVGGLVTLPGAGETVAKAPLMAFAAARAQNQGVKLALRGIQDAIAAARRRAIDAFGAACDAEAARLRAAIGDRKLEGHIVEVAGDLIERLVAAFGPRLLGLSPHARLIALDWLRASGPERLRLSELAA
jgi:hypothetical protein